jgi:hypothetical protein
MTIISVISPEKKLRPSLKEVDLLQWGGLGRGIRDLFKNLSGVSAYIVIKKMTYLWYFFKQK